MLDIKYEGLLIPLASAKKYPTGVIYLDREVKFERYAAICVDCVLMGNIGKHTNIHQTEMEIECMSADVLKIWKWSKEGIHANIEKVEILKPISSFESSGNENSDQCRPLGAVAGLIIEPNKKWALEEVKNGSKNEEEDILIVHAEADIELSKKNDSVVQSSPMGRTTFTRGVMHQCTPSRDDGSAGRRRPALIVNSSAPLLE